jgi:hypothetical protein
VKNSEPSNERLNLERSLIELLRVAARDDDLRAWFRVDPEMATIRKTGIAPKEITSPPQESESEQKHEELS